MGAQQDIQYLRLDPSLSSRLLASWESEMDIFYADLTRILALPAVVSSARNNVFCEKLILGTFFLVVLHVYVSPLIYTIVDYHYVLQ